MIKKLSVLSLLLFSLIFVTKVRAVGGNPWDELQAVVTELQQQVSSLWGAVFGLQQNVADIQATDADLQNQISNIELVPGPSGPPGPQGEVGPSLAISGSPVFAQTLAVSETKEWSWPVAAGAYYISGRVNYRLTSTVDSPMAFTCNLISPIGSLDVAEAFLSGTNPKSIKGSMTLTGVITTFSDGNFKIRCTANNVPFGYLIGIDKVGISLVKVGSTLTISPN